jgi:hypothetical protein
MCTIVTVVNAMFSNVVVLDAVKFLLPMFFLNYMNKI